MSSSPDSPVQLRLAAHDRYVRLARAVASSLGAANGYDVEEIDDLRIAVDELCNALLVLGDSTTITLELAEENGALVVRGSAPARREGSVGAWENSDHELSRQILDVVATSYELETRDGTVSFVLRPRRRA